MISNVQSKLSLVVAGTVFTLAMCQLTAHGGNRRECLPGGGCYGGATCYEMVETTCYVPRTFTETRTVKCTEYRHEVREETYNVHRCVPEVKTLTREYTVMVPKTMSKTVAYTVQVPVWKPVEQTYTVMVPHQEERTAERTVCKPVVTQVEREYKSLTRDYETALKRNEYWMARLDGVHMFGRDPHEILTRNQRIDAVTPQVLQETFKTYFPSDRMTIVTLVPAPQ